jgi:hypothetical protein
VQGDPDEYWAEIHVGALDEGDDLNWGADDVESCKLAHVRVTAEDCGENSGDDETGSGGVGFTIDNTAPTTNDDDVTGLRVTGEVASAYCEDDCLVGGSMVNILFDYSDNCGPLTAKLEYRACNGEWITIVDDLALPGIVGDDYAYPWLVPPTLDCCGGDDGGIEFMVTVTDCPGETAQATYETCVEAPLILVDCITGWAWSWGPNIPVNANARDTIMVVFNKPLELDGADDCNQVTKEDFRVDNITPLSISIHKDGIGGRDNGVWQGYTYVFLKVPTMATDAVRTVKLVGCVAAEDPNIEPLDGREELIECITQDGIAPIITVTPSTEEPEYNELVTVTVTASECLNEAYLFIGKGNPADYDWNMCKPIGWPTDWWTQGDDGRVPGMPPLPPTCPKGPYPEWGEIPMDEDGNEMRACVWENWDCCTLTTAPASPRGCDRNWIAMEPAVDQACNTDSNMDTWDGSKTWTVTFRNTDFSHWLPTYPWKHEKWTQESFLFWGLEVYRVELCEGWNLVSVPWKLEDPSPAGAFGPAMAQGTTGYGGITKAYYYTGGQFGSWRYTALNPVTGAWTGTLTQIVPGEAYWVWVSPPRIDWIVRTVDPKDDPAYPMVVLPSYALKKGWNMVGYTYMEYEEAGWPWMRRMGGLSKDPVQMKWYLETLRENASLAYAYVPCGNDYPVGWDCYQPTGDPQHARCYVEEWSGPGWIRFHAGGDDNWVKAFMVPGYGLWLFLNEDGILAP